MRKILFFISLLFSGLCYSQNQLLVPTSSINFNEVLLNDTKYDSIVVRNVTAFALTYNVSLIQNYVPPVNNNTECGSITNASPILVQVSNKPFSGTLNPGEKFVMYIGFNPQAYNISLYQGMITICPTKGNCSSVPDCNAHQTVDGLGKYLAEVQVSQTNGQTFTKTITISGTGVSQITEVPTFEDNSESLSISPNPVENSFFVNDENVTYAVYSASGVKVKEGYSKSNEILVSDLESGVYLVKINTDSKQYVSRFVKK